MSVQLDFYSVSWKEIEGIVGSRKRRVARQVIDAFDEEFDEVFPDDLFGAGPTFDEGVYRWVEGGLGPSGAAVEVTQLGDALGFIALVKHRGKLAGSVSSAGTGEKLDRFLELAVQALGAPWPAEHLLARSILGFHRIHVPTWGGLSRAELGAVAPKLAGDPPEDPNDDDNDAWYVDFWNALGGVSDLGQDLITIYA